MSPLACPSHSTFPEVASETETISNVASLNDRIAALWEQPEVADVTLRLAGERRVRELVARERETCVIAERR